MTPIHRPPEWRIATLADVAARIPNAIVDGPFGSSLKLTDYTTSGVPVLQGKNITNNEFRWFDIRYISEEKANALKRSSVAVGDILIVKIGSIGYSAVIRDIPGSATAIIPANLAKVTPNPSLIDTQYLHQWLTSPVATQYLAGAASKTAQPALSLRKIKQLPVPVPPLKEQRRIADILARADALRAKRRDAIAHLDTLTQSIFLEMFGDLATAAEMDRSTRLGEVLTFVTSGSRGWAQYYAPSGSRFVRSLDVQMNLIASDSAVFVDPPSSAEARRTRVQPGDVLLTITGSRIGRVAAAPKDLAGAYVSQHVAILRLDQRKVDPEFVAYCLSMEAGQRQIAEAHYGQTKPGLNLDQIRSLHVPRPPVAEQQEFKKRLAAARSVAALQEKALATLDALFSSLQHRAFRGEL